MQRWNNKANEGDPRSLDAELRCRLWWRWWIWCTWWVKNAWMHACVLTNKTILFTQGKQRTRTRTKTRQANLKCVYEHTKILLNQDDKNKNRNRTSTKQVIHRNRIQNLQGNHQGYKEDAAVLRGHATTWRDGAPSRSL